MAAVLRLDETVGSVLQTGIGSVRGRRIRTGRVTGITVTGTPALPDQTVLERCLAVAGMPQLGAALPRTGVSAVDAVTQDFVLLQHIFSPFASNHIKVTLVYAPPSDTYSGTPSSFLIRDSNRLIREQTNMWHGPARSIPIRIGWEDPDDPNNVVPDDFVPMIYDKPFRVINLTGLVYGTPNPSPTVGQLRFAPPPRPQREAIGCVNYEDFYGYPRGYWRVEAYETDTRTASSYYTVVSELSSNKTRDWSSFGILRNQMTGRYVPTKQSDIDDLRETNYTYGVITTNRGLVKVGFYEPIDFTTLFPILV